jgi:hypothetical protein
VFMDNSYVLVADSIQCRIHRWVGRAHTHGTWLTAMLTDSGTLSRLLFSRGGQKTGGLLIMLFELVESYVTKYVGSLSSSNVCAFLSAAGTG